MPISAKYVHTNLVARDWRALAAFYERVFGCIPVPPERDLHGDLLDAGTGLIGAHARGIHLRLPGYDAGGPTLEILGYEVFTEHGAAAPNSLGFAHIAFSVADVHAAREAVLQAGGRAVGEVVTIAIELDAQVTWCYVTDLEGNIVELQTWSKSLRKS